MDAVDRSGYVGQEIRVGVVQRAIAFLGLVATAPFLAVAAAVIRLTSPGPVVYRAARVGRGTVPFTMYKLRTMHLDSARLGSLTSGADPRIFPAGRWLRRLKLDEVPQLVNVARGEMAFVGPRPEAPDILEAHYRPWMFETLRVAPGITSPGSLVYFQEEALLPSEPQEAMRVYAEVLLPRKLARDLVLVRRYTTAYQLELVARTLLGIVGLDRLARRRQAQEEAQARAILVEVGEASAG